jgi:hypothetical protein
MLVWLIPIVGVSLLILIYYRQPWYYVELSSLVVAITIVCEFLFGFGMLDHLLHSFDFHCGGIDFGDWTGNWTWGNFTLGNETLGNMTIGNITEAMP